MLNKKIFPEHKTKIKELLTTIVDSSLENAEKTAEFLIKTLELDSKWNDRKDALFFGLYENKELMTRAFSKINALRKEHLDSQLKRIETVLNNLIEMRW